jgi:hypothetical protein
MIAAGVLPADVPPDSGYVTDADAEAGFGEQNCLPPGDMTPRTKLLDCDCVGGVNPGHYEVTDAQLVVVQLSVLAPM